MRRDVALVACLLGEMLHPFTVLYAILAVTMWRDHRVPSGSDVLGSMARTSAQLAHEVKELHVLRAPTLHQFIFLVFAFAVVRVAYVVAVNLMCPSMTPRCSARCHDKSHQLCRQGDLRRQATPILSRYFKAQVPVLVCVCAARLICACMLFSARPTPSPDTQTFAPLRPPHIARSTPLVPFAQEMLVVEALALPTLGLWGFVRNLDLWTGSSTSMAATCSAVTLAGAVVLLCLSLLVGFVNPSDSSSSLDELPLFSSWMSSLVLLTDFAKLSSVVLHGLTLTLMSGYTLVSMASTALGYGFPRIGYGHASLPFITALAGQVCLEVTCGMAIVAWCHVSSLVRLKAKDDASHKKHTPIVIQRLFSPPNALREFRDARARSRDSRRLQMPPPPSPVRKALPHLSDHSPVFDWTGSSLPRDDTPSRGSGSGSSHCSSRGARGPRLRGGRLSSSASPSASVMSPRSSSVPPVPVPLRLGHRSRSLSCIPTQRVAVAAPAPVTYTPSPYLPSPVRAPPLHRRRSNASPNPLAWENASTTSVASDRPAHGGDSPQRCALPDGFRGA